MYQKYRGVLLKRTFIIYSFVFITFVYILARSLFSSDGRLNTLVNLINDPYIEISEHDLGGKYLGFDNETGSSTQMVPDMVHVILFDSEEVSFISFFSMTSVLKIHKPKKLMIHTNRPPLKGRFFELLKWVINNNYIDGKNEKTELEVKFLEKPTEIFGVKLSSVYHASDIARIQVLMKYGGIYLDTDQIVLKPLNKFLHFEMVLGWPDDQYLGTQILIAVKDARFLKLWLKSYQHYKPLRWYYNAGQLPTTAILYQHPELVHRERNVLGVKEFYYEMWTDNPWTEWKKFYSLHLFIRHKPANTLNVSEVNIHKLNCPVSEMANKILYKLPPVIDFNMKLPKHS